MRNKPTLSQFFLGALSIFAIGFVIGLFLLSIFVAGAKITFASNLADYSVTSQCFVTLTVPSQYDLDESYVTLFGETQTEIYLRQGVYPASGTTLASKIGYPPTLSLGDWLETSFFNRVGSTQQLTFDLDDFSLTGSGYLLFGLGDLTVDQYATFFRNGTDDCDPVSGPSEEINGNIYTTINAPLPYGTTTASTTVNLSVSFTQNASFDFAVIPATSVGYDVFDAVTNELQFSYNTTFEENTAVVFTNSTTTVLAQGSKIMIAYIRDLNGNDLALQKDTFFNVITNTYASSTGLTTPRENPASLTQIDCATFDIGCQFQKALTFLFVPSDAVLNRYSGLWQQIRNKVPFGYVSAVIDQLEGLDGNATPAFDLGDLPFINILFTPLRDAFGVILWGIYAIYFYRHRLTQLDI